MPDNVGDRDETTHDATTGTEAGQARTAAASPPTGAGGRNTVEPTVGSSLDGDVATLTVGGELTEQSRRPLVRTMTDLLLTVPSLRQVHLDLRAVTFMNSAGMAILVQLQRMASPRGITVALVAPPQVVVRPLQLTGLWRRFPILEEESGA